MTNVTINVDLDTITDGARHALAALFGGSTAVATGTVNVPDKGATPVSDTPSTPVTAPAVDKYFPAQSGDALFPSPENSRMIRGPDGTISGKPYLLDENGTETRLVSVIPPADADKALGHQDCGIEIAGQRRRHYLGTIISAAIVRNQKVYVQLSGGQWQHFEYSTGSFYNASLPDVTTTDGTTAKPETVVPPMPSASSVAPGSSGRVLVAPPGSVASTLASAKDGDTVALDGQYAEPFPIINVSLLMRLASGTVLDFTDQPLAQGKGGIVPTHDFILEGPTVDQRPATIMGAGIKETSAGGTAGLRPGNTCYVTVRGAIDFVGNQNGIAGGGFPWVLDMTDTVLDGNGLGDGYTHNMYATDTISVKLNRVTSRNAKGGHAVKARTYMFVAADCDLSGEETLIDLPEGTATVALVTNTKLTKTPGAANHRLFGYGEENSNKGTMGMMVFGGVVTGGEGSFIQGNGTVIFSATSFVGDKPTGNGSMKVMGV